LAHPNKERTVSVFDELKWRGLLYDATEGAEEHLAGQSVTLYIGFDPSAASLHVGSLLQILALARMQRDGHSPIALVGGGTGMIGDPSGKSEERRLMSVEEVERNCEGIRSQLERFLDFKTKKNPARLVNNGEWLNTIPLVEFLREVGKCFTVNYMLAKESVQRRLGSEEGLSYAEFSYLLFQSYDFVVLNDRYGCTLQMGGSDQWGNITAGAELLRKIRQKKAHGIVGPLVTKASGAKFGKSESGNVWLDAELTSPYRFYQFWLSSDDDDVVKYLKYFTWLDREAIAELEAAHQAAPQEREAHRRLAREITAMVHGETAVERAVRSSEVLFGGELADLATSEILDIFDEVPSTTLSRFELDGDGLPLADLLVTSGLAASKGAARRLIRDGGAYVNNRRAGDERATLRVDDFLDGAVLVLRKGQKKYHLVTLTPEGANDV
jgi:tyrosyl-tRNA synthetase